MEQDIVEKTSIFKSKKLKIVIGFFTMLALMGISSLVIYNRFYKNEEIMEEPISEVTLSGNLLPDGHITLEGQANINGPIDVIGELHPNGGAVIRGVDRNINLKGKVSLVGKESNVSLSYLGITELTTLTGSIDESGKVTLAGKINKELSYPVTIETSEGPQGEIRLSGEIGPQGEQGPIGLTGQLGPQGEIGLQGPQGIFGFKGDSGEKGEKGLQGEVGLTGPVGLTGEIGPVGSQGDTGPQGPEGPKGDKGDPGLISSSSVVTGSSVSTSTGASDGTELAATATCPSGSILLSGGGQITTTDPSKGKAVMKSNYPSSSDTWTIRAMLVRNLAPGTTMTLVPYVVCGQ